MSEYTQKDLAWAMEKAAPVVASLRNQLFGTGLDSVKVQHEIAMALISVRAEAQQAFFNDPNVQKVGRSIDARLAAAEKLAQTASEVPEPEDEGACKAGCGMLDLVKEEVLPQSGEKYTRYFFKHKNCWYGRLRAALAELEIALK